MAVIVTVSRAYPVAGTRAEQLDAVSGYWSVRHVDSSEDFENSSEAAALLDAADFLIAVRRNIVVEALEIDGHQITDEGQVAFEVNENPALSRLTGQRLAPDFAWRKGQGWPVLTAVLGRGVSDYREIVEPEGEEPIEVREIGGTYEVTMHAKGSLTVVAPRGRSVTVTTRQ